MDTPIAFHRNTSFGRMCGPFSGPRKKLACDVLVIVSEHAGSGVSVCSAMGIHGHPVI